jgi:hypothetical protein
MACAMANAAPVCRHEVQIDAIREALAHTRFVSYQPTALRIIDGKATHANEASIADDLTVLRSRFDGLITYGASSGAERVPDVAAALGYKAVIVGVWDPSSDEEVGKAIAAWGRHPQLVVGISLGNETVLGKRFDFESLGGAIGEVRRKRRVSYCRLPSRSTCFSLKPRRRCCTSWISCSRTFIRCSSRGSRAHPTKRLRNSSSTSSICWRRRTAVPSS